VKHLPRLLAAGLLVVLVGCSAADQDPAELAAPAPTTTVAEAPSTTVVPEPDPEGVRIARSDTSVIVREAPAGEAAVLTELPATTPFGSARALLVLDEEDGWLEVQVPERPNNRTGFVDAAQVELVTGAYEINVDLDARTLTVLEDGAAIIETPVAIGSPESPTPTGTFPVIDRLQSPNPDGDYGPVSLGVGGFSDTFSEFAGGNGQIGIHGTNDPSSIGQAVSHGCIRVPNDVALQLGELIPLGTPVTIV
jgi:lipoprotein-anchoring transpeptidase ErfK/SrfK